MPKITFEKFVRADREKIFSIVTDYEKFQNIMPQYFPSIRVRSARDNVAVIEEHLKIAGKELVMMTKHVVHPHSLHEVFVIGGDGKGSTISEKYESVSGGTIVTVDANLKLSGVLKITGFFGRKKIRDSLSKIMDEFASVAES